MVTLNNCHKCDLNSLEGNADCASCKLSELKKRAAQKRAESESVKADSEPNKKFRIDDDDDPSISERLTENGNDHSILILFVIAFMTFLLVILFTIAMK